MAFSYQGTLIKTPAEAFKECPYCRSGQLLRLEEDVFCQVCEWDSLAIHAELSWLPERLPAQSTLETFNKREVTHD